MQPGTVPPARDAVDEFTTRLEAYARARDLYLRAEMDWLRGRDKEGLEQQLESVRASSDFRVAYDLLLDRARNSITTRPALASRVLTALQEARPERPEAGRLLRQLQ